MTSLSSDWFTFLLRIWEVLVSKTVPETGTLTKLFCYFPLTILINAGVELDTIAYISILSNGLIPNYFVIRHQMNSIRTLQYLFYRLLGEARLGCGTEDRSSVLAHSTTFCSSCAVALRLNYGLLWSVCFDPAHRDFMVSVVSFLCSTLQ
jgi:hypothetical protein